MTLDDVWLNNDHIICYKIKLFKYQVYLAKKNIENIVLKCIRRQNNIHGLSVVKILFHDEKKIEN